MIAKSDNRTRTSRGRRSAGYLSAAILCLSGSVMAGQGTEIVLDCSAAGYDIRIRNTAETTLQPGRAVEWEVRFVRRSGVHDIEVPLEPGAAVLVSGALGSDYLSAPQPCSAVVVPETPG